METKISEHRLYMTLPKGDSQISICVHVPAAGKATVSTAVLFLHSLNGCKLGPNDMFPYVADRLSAAGIYCIRFDYIGSGESTWREGVDNESKADDTKSIIEYIRGIFKISRFSLVSISNSASLIFYLCDIAPQIHSMILLSPILMNIENTHNVSDVLYNHLMEYGRKLFRKETYIKFMHGQIDLKGIFMVFKKTGFFSNKNTKNSDNQPDLSKIKHIAPIPVVLVVGNRDPYCKNKLPDYKSFIRAYDLNWQIYLLPDAGHNFISLEDRNNVIHVIYEAICKNNGKI